MAQQVQGLIDSEYPGRGQSPILILIRIAHNSWLMAICG